MECRREERAADVVFAAGEGLVATALPNGWHCYARILLDKYQVERNEWEDRFPNLNQSLRGPSQMRTPRLRRIVVDTTSHIDAKSWIPCKSICVYRLDDGVEEKDLHGFEE